MKKILVLCTSNSCRSQMAEGYLRHFAKYKVAVYSAGIETHGVNPRAIAAMKEDGIDISKHTSKTIDELLSSPLLRRGAGGEVFDFIITVCDKAKESCPYFPSKAKKFHQNFPDPARATGTEEEIMQQFRIVRKKIKLYCEEFITTNL
ncbi:MAG: arsenate reductase ArsC [Bacteroidia bacterium]